MICTCGVNSAGAVNWQQFGQDSTGVSWFIDQDSIKVDDKNATVDIKAQDSEGYHFVATEEFNRTDKTVKDVKVTLYNPQGYVEREESVDATARAVTGGSPSEAVYNHFWAPTDNAAVDNKTDDNKKVDKKTDKKSGKKADKKDNKKVDKKTDKKSIKKADKKDKKKVDKKTDKKSGKKADKKDNKKK